MSDDPEDRIRELEQGVSMSKGANPPPPPVAWQQPQAPMTAEKKSRTPMLIALAGVGVLVVISILVAFVMLSRPSAPIAADRESRTPTTSLTSEAAPPPSTTTSVAPKGPTNLHTAEGLSALLETIRVRFGDTMGFSMNVNVDFAEIDRASPTDNRVKERWLYRNGAWADKPLPGVSTSSFDQLADLGTFDVAAVTAQIASAPGVLTISAAKKTYLIVRGGASGALDLSIHVNGPPSGFIDVNPDGSVKRIHPPS